MRFYTERIGFKPHIASPAFGMFDGGTATRPHIVAFNNWGGGNLPKPSASSAGLQSFTIELPAAELDALGPSLAATTTTTWDGTQPGVFRPRRQRGVSAPRVTNPRKQLISQEDLADD